MSDETPASEKEHEPTQRRLEQAREKGDAPKLSDLTAAVSLLGHVAAVWLLGHWMVQNAGPVLARFLSYRPQGDLAAAGALLAGVFVQIALAGAALFGPPLILVFVTLLAFKGLRVTGENLTPKLSRISLVANAGNKFGRAGLVEFAKSTAKLALISLVLFWVLSDQSDAIIRMAQLDTQQSLPRLFGQMIWFLGIIVLLAGVIAGVDHLWQRAEFLRRNRMSRKELMDELKEQEGDPATKAKRRQKGIDIAQNRMLADVPKADVVIVNPTHYAVALKWDPASGRAPVCLAKGVDEIAARIRERADAASVPIHSDPPTARALHAVVAVGEEIHPEHYRAVAAAIRYAERIRKLGGAHARAER